MEDHRYSKEEDEKPQKSSESKKTSTIKKRIISNPENISDFISKRNNDPSSAQQFIKALYSLFLDATSQSFNEGGKRQPVDILKDSLFELFNKKGLTINISTYESLQNNITSFRNTVLSAIKPETKYNTMSETELEILKNADEEFKKINQAFHSAVIEYFFMDPLLSKKEVKLLSLFKSLNDYLEEKGTQKEKQEALDKLLQTFFLGKNNTLSLSYYKQYKKMIEHFIKAHPTSFSEVRYNIISKSFSNLFKTFASKMDEQFDILCNKKHLSLESYQAELSDSFREEGFYHDGKSQNKCKKMFFHYLMKGSIDIFMDQIRLQNPSGEKEKTKILNDIAHLFIAVIEDKIKLTNWKSSIIGNEKISFEEYGINKTIQVPSAIASIFNTCQKAKSDPDKSFLYLQEIISIGNAAKPSAFSNLLQMQDKTVKNFYQELDKAYVAIINNLNLIQPPASLLFKY